MDNRQIGRRLLPTSLVFLLLVSLSDAKIQNDFSLYPAKSQSCLTQASDSSGCTGDTVTAMNSCLCSNGGNFVTNTAKCLGTNDIDDVLAVYSTLSSACADSKTPLNVEKAMFFSAAGMSTVTSSATSKSTASASKTTATTAKTTATGTASETASDTAATPTETGGSEDENKGADGGSSGSSLSGRARAGIIAGSVCAGLAMLGAAVFFLLRYRKKKEGEESHPMLPHKLMSSGVPSVESGPLPTSADVSALAANDDPDWPRDTKWRPTPGSDYIATPGGFNWESPYDSTPPTGWGRVPSAPPEEALWSAPPPSKSPSAQSIAQSVAPSQVYELQGSARPVEIAGTPILPPGADKAYSGDGWGPALGKR